MEREKLIATVTAAQTGDSGALNTLFNAFYNDVYYFALKTVKDDDLACDITQETFVEIINTIGDLHEPAAFVNWMKRITYHQCTRYFKKKKDVLVDEDEEGNTVFDTLAEDKTEFIPDEALDQQDFRDTILAMLDELSEEQRAATMLYYYDELSVKQIAEIQNVSEGTVKSRLNYARKSIKSSVETYEKKNGVKLHCAGVLPLMLWLLSQTGKETMPAAAAKTVAGGVSAATGVAVSAATVAAVSAKPGTFTGTIAAKAVKAGKKSAAAALSTKLLAGALVISLIATGGLAVLSAMQQDKIQSLSEQIADLQKTVYALQAGSSAHPGSTAPVDPTQSQDTTTSITETLQYVPENCTYVMEDGTVLNAGEVLPQTPSLGDELITEDYTYKYGYSHYESHVLSAHVVQWMNSGLSGWGVRVNDKTKTGYSELISQINGAPVVHLGYAFYGCSNMVTAPDIPEGITSMAATFLGCSALRTAPQIPASVEHLHSTFYGCAALTEVPQLPVGVKNMIRTFKNCTSLETPPNIPEGVIDIEGVFEGCQLLKNAPVIPATVKNMSHAFMDCRSLTLPPEIPYGVTNISFAFYDCKALTQKPVIPESVTEAQLAFFGCSSLPKES